MKKNADRIVELWKKLSSDLSLEIIAPFHLKIGHEINLSIPVLVKHFGGEEGMLISDNFESIRDISDQIVSAGYGISFPDISENWLSRYNPESFISMLIDWSWTGSEGNQPEWMLTEISRKNNIVQQSGNSKNKCIEFDKILAEAGSLEMEAYLTSVDRAIEIATHFTEFHWQYIAGLWRDRPPEWQCGLAQCLEELQPPFADEWLLHMMESPNDYLVRSALENFRNLQRARFEKKAVPKALIPRIRELWREHFKFTETQLEQMLDDLASGADAQK